MIVIADYGMGNVGAIENMVKRVGGEGAASTDPRRAESAAKLVLPGVGAFDNGVASLEATGWWDAIRSFAKSGRPLLGICLGMQLLGATSEEGARAGLGLVRARTIRIAADEKARPPRRVPHMGWNEVAVKRSSPLLRGLERDARFYFAHSFHLVCDDDDVLATTDYGGPITACLQHENVFGTQFHPEKSHRFGLTLFRNFVHDV